MDSPDGYILEVNPPEIVDGRISYIRDVLKWGFTISASSQMSGFFFRDGKLIQRTRTSGNASTGNTSTTTDTKLTLQSATLVHPVRMEMPSSYDPRRSLQDYELFVYDIHSTDEYTVAVGMPGGQNEHLFRVQLDTGSSSRWVFGAGCKISGEPSDHAKRRLPIHTLYHPGPRALCHGQRRFATRYRDGSNIEGPVYTDTWCFPTRTGSNLSVNVVFGVVEKVDYLLAMSRIDGILGLGFGPPQPGTFNQTEPHSLSTVLRSEDLTANYRFCIAISRRGRSFLSLGCIPPEAPSPRFWIPVITDTGKWIIPCYGFGWGHSPTDGNFEKVTLPERPGSMHILLDSGTTHCYFPNNIVKFVYQKLGGREGGSEGFQLRNQLPDPTNIKQQMWINLGGSWNAWPQEALYGELADPAVSSADAAWYHGRLKSQGDDPKTCSILGVAFFEHYYVYFDADRNKAKVALEPRRQG